MAYFGFSFCCGFGLAVFTVFCHLAQCKAKLNVTLKLSCVKPRPLRSPVGSSNWKSRNSTVPFVNVAW